MVEAVEDRLRGHPLATRPLAVAGGLAAVGRADQRGRLPVPVAVVTVQLERALVALGRSPVPAQVVVGESQAVPGAGLPVPVATLQLQGQRQLAVGDRLLVVAEL